MKNVYRFVALLLFAYFVFSLGKVCGMRLMNTSVLDQALQKGISFSVGSENLFDNMIAGYLVPAIAIGITAFGEFRKMLVLPLLAIAGGGVSYVLYHKMRWIPVNEIRLHQPTETWMASTQILDVISLILLSTMIVIPVILHFRSKAWIAGFQD